MRFSIWAHPIKGVLGCLPILDILFYEASANNGEKIGYTFFLSTFWPFVFLFFPFKKPYYSLFYKKYMKMPPYKIHKSHARNMWMN